MFGSLIKQFCGLWNIFGCKNRIGISSNEMSHHSADENMLIATSDSFWEPGNYRRTTRRIDDSFRLCSDLVQLLNERSDIEKNYAKNLKCWSKKWNDLIERGPEYGTTEAAWKGMLVEADRLSDIHLKMKDKLTGDLVEQVRTWQKDTYQKSSTILQGVIQCKVRKEMEDSFKKVQKPWAKLLAKVNKTKANYHGACKAEKSALNQERNANNDSSLSQDQLKKLQDRVLRAKDDVQKTREKYESSLQDLHNYNAKYMDDMSIVFDRCQDLETMRLQFFKQVLFSIHQVLNISQYAELPQIYDEFQHTINNADYEKDLKWWSNNHGVNMAMNWPQFEEYVEEFREITKGKSKESLPVPNILLINQRPVGEDFRDPPPMQVGSSASSATTAAATGAVASNTKSNVTSTSTTAAAASTASINMSKLLRNTNEMTISSTSSTSLASNGGGGGGGSKPTAPSVTAATAPSNNNPQLNKRLLSSSNGSAGRLNASHNRSSVDSGGGGGGGPRNDTNPFDDESGGGGNADDDEWEENDDCLVDNGEPGVPVRALYDYEQAENDELSFKQGDVFEKLEDEDEQGWCKGRKDGRVGLYPANYVKEIS